MRRQSRLWLALVLLASPALAGYDQGIRAYRDGDYGAALLELMPLADEGHPQAQYRIGLMYFDGRGLPQSDEKAVSWYRKAADQGIAGAQYNLGFMFEGGRGVPQSYDDAMRWYRLAAAQGYARAQNNLGWLLCCVRSAAHNDEEALGLFHAAGAQGNALAEANLGSLYLAGRGTSRNRVEAFLWLSRAAAHGRSAAQTTLDRVVPEMSDEELAQATTRAIAEYEDRNYPEAREQLGRLADRGLPDAQYHLALMYLRGQGVSRSPEEATRWMQMAADAGQEDARLELSEMEGKAHAAAARQAEEDAADAADAAQETPTDEEAAENKIYAHGAGGLSMPRVIRKVEPEFPGEARQAKVSGNVILEIVVSKEGAPTDIVVQSCDQPGFGFEEAAMTAVQLWVYQPGKINGVAVSVRMPVIVEFILK